MPKVSSGPAGGQTARYSLAWAHVTISALDHPNVIEGREVIPGAVSRQAVEDIAREFGRESGFYAIAVLGLFAGDAINQLIRAEWWDAAVPLARRDAGRGREPGAPADRRRSYSSP